MTSREILKPPHPALTPPGDPYLDYGPALPGRYGVEVVFAIARDPGTVWAYWEVEGAGRAVLRDVQRGVVSTADVTGPCGSHYFAAAAGREYVVEIDGRASNRVRTPPRGPSGDIDPEWEPTAEQAEILKELTRGALAPALRPGYGASQTSQKSQDSQNRESSQDRGGGPEVRRGSGSGESPGRSSPGSPQVRSPGAHVRESPKPEGVRTGKAAPTDGRARAVKTVNPVKPARTATTGKRATAGRKVKAPKAAPSTKARPAKKTRPAAKKKGRKGRRP